MMDEATRRRLQQDHEELKRRCLGLSLEETLAELEAAGVRFDPKDAVRRIQLAARRYDAALRVHVRNLTLEENVRELRDAGIDFDPARAAARLRSRIELARAERSAAEAAQRVQSAAEAEPHDEAGRSQRRQEAVGRILAAAARVGERGTAPAIALRDALQNLAASLARTVPRPGETERALEEARQAVQRSAGEPSELLAAAMQAIDEASDLATEPASAASYAYLFRNLDSESDQYDREQDLEEMERDARALQFLQELAKIEEDEAK